MWFLERFGDSVDGGDNPQFPESLTQGGQEGVWWAMVTTTTVGYGDKTVKQGFARIIAALWMIVGFIAMACIIGALASGLTVPSVDDELVTTAGLHDVKTCVYSAYTTDVQQYGPELTPSDGVESIADCYAMLKNGTVDAVVYDSALLLAARMQDTELRKFSVGRNFKHFTQQGFVSSSHNTPAVTTALNWGLNKFLYNKAMKDAVNIKWMGSDSEAYSEEDEGSYNTVALVLSLSLWGFFMFLQFLSMNNPWIEYLREMIPHGYGVHKFVFGTDEVLPSPPPFGPPATACVHRDKGILLLSSAAPCL